MLKKGDRTAVVCCSNPLAVSRKAEAERLAALLRQIGLVPVLSDFLYEDREKAEDPGCARAAELMEFYQDKTIRAVFDLSGGDLANEILPYLDFEVIAASGKLFWGYSDLTCVINALYACAGVPSVLYQVRNLLYEHSKEQIRDFGSTVFKGHGPLFSFSYTFWQGRCLQGVVVGGNVRCLLKLAGTRFWPDMRQKVLLLEAYSGRIPQLTAYFSQLRQIGVFDQISGILLGTFTQLEQESEEEELKHLVKRFAGPGLPIVRTRQIGHGSDAKAIIIGGKIELS